MSIRTRDLPDEELQKIRSNYKTPTKQTPTDIKQYKRQFQQEKVKLLRLLDQAKNLRTAIVNDESNVKERADFLIKCHRMYKSYGISKKEEMKDVIADNYQFTSELNLDNDIYYDISTGKETYDKTCNSSAYSARHMLKIAKRFHEMACYVYKESKSDTLSEPLAEYGWKCIEALDFPLVRTERRPAIRVRNHLSLPEAIRFMDNLLDLREKYSGFLARSPLYPRRSGANVPTVEEMLKESANLCAEYDLQLQFKYGKSPESYRSYSAYDAVLANLTDLI